MALEQLREDENIRTQALTQFREWIAKHPHIKRCRTDAVFLLRFLRTKKFSVSAACEMLENYLTIRQLYPHWFQKLDIDNPQVEAILKTGYIVPLLERDDQGRQIILLRPDRIDPNRCTSENLAKIHSVVCEAYLDDEESQVAGYVNINDHSGLRMGHISMWSFVDIRHLLKCIQNSTPMRHKASHIFNLPSFANAVIEFASAALSEKLRNRIYIHKTVEELKHKLNPDILPKEYGGKVAAQEMVDQMLKRVREKRNEIVALDEMFIEITKTPANLAGSDNADMDAGIIGSFRKLEVD